MNYWLRRAEFKEMASQFMDLFRGKYFACPDDVVKLFHSMKNTIYAKHPKLAGDVHVRFRITESVPGKQYFVEAVSVDDDNI